MNFLNEFAGLLFVLIFFLLLLTLNLTGKKKTIRNLREITAFLRLRRVVGLAVEAGSRIHISVGREGVTGSKTASALVGLAMLERIARAASVSDRPPVVTSGDSTLTILSQDTLRTTYRNVNAENLYDPAAGRLTGLTPFSYAAGAMPVIHDEQVSSNVLIGNFGSEIALLTEAAEQGGSVTIAGSDDLTAQAVLFATAQEPLIGEEMFAGGAYLNAGPAHIASLRAQDILRWALIVVILAGAIAKGIGLL